VEPDFHVTPSRLGGPTRPVASSRPAMTPRQMRAKAEKLEAQAAPMLARAKQLRAAADTIERALRSAGLQTRTDYNTFKPMQDQEKSVPPPRGKRRGPPLEARGRLAATIADELGVSLRALAGTIGEKEDSLRTWDRRNSHPARVLAALKAAQSHANPGSTKEF